jgi:hypothetical protein
MRSLLLDYNKIGDRGAVALSCALMGNATLQLLRCATTPARYLRDAAAPLALAPFVGLEPARSSSEL